MDFCVSGAPVTRKRRQLRGYLVELRQTDPIRFATLPDDRTDIDDDNRAVLLALLSEMVALRLYQPMDEYKLPGRLLTLRQLIGEARAL